MTPIARSLVSATLLVLCVAPAAAAQDYRSLVAEYRHNGISAVPKAAALTHDQIAEGRHALAGSWETLRAAAMLHTEAMLLLAAARQFPSAVRHLDAAVALLEDVMKLVPSQRDFVFRWQGAVEPPVRQALAPAVADSLVAKQRVWFPSAFLRTRERYARAKMLEEAGCLQGLAPTAPLFGPAGATSQPSRWWADAVQLYKDALAEDPAFLAAALHLGRIQMLTAHLDAASVSFERARRATDPAVAYLATLYLGSLEERAGRLGPAERLYRDAIAAYPWGQAAQLALAQILSRTGREADARALVLARLGRGEAIVEPHWNYLVLPGKELAAVFDELRVEVWR